ncbi:hypothetical protein DICPUDRAFT_155202 [Dictyostelium purpureum]|uniref:Rho-GAP domain-containing protein n=1 Tax=Dictyostelium purpureum TaxID=5786 RepID=F0ZTC2_DICPU|nr:uncharacterized protein DICPUDRAFT_155202 [Dictyostelium purpureum]EGC32806.1 hypothetical protein DICPUDRAFT_155202 [Dictyostelium purpureum]|eukprot:XP_003290664.1 hypothetical protein DICPUDRAFT_155202 [Dictyostelium purpureum]
MRKFKKSISITKQNLMEKTGNKENTLEPDQMKELEKQVTDTKDYLRKLTKSVEKETLSSGLSIQDGTELADNFIDYSVYVRENQTDMVILSGILSKIGEFQAGFEDLKAKLNSSLINDVSDPLKSIIKTELKQAKESKKEYDRVRIGFDAQLSELQTLKKQKNVKPQKIQECEDECERLRTNFERVGIDTTCLLQDTNVITEFETVEKLCDYLDSYHTFFQKGYRWLAQMIPDIYEYRLYVEKRKAELEKSKVRISMMVSPQKQQQDAISKSKIFGEDLSVILQREGSIIPRFVTRAFQAIRNHISTEEGLFRLSGTKRIIFEYKAKIDEGKEYNLNEISDIHVVCNLVKMFLRELQPEPLLTYSRYNELIDTCNIEDSNQRVEKITKILQSLPKHYFTLLHHLIHLLHQISTQPKSKMGPANLATVVGPNILICQTDVVLEDIALGNMVVTTIIQNFEKIFGGEPEIIVDSAPAFTSSQTTPTFNNNQRLPPPVYNNNNNSTINLNKDDDEEPYDPNAPPIYSGVPMKGNNLHHSDSCSTLDDSFDSDNAVELSD